MGCASSKQIESAVDVYRPAPASFAVFDINAIEEPWVKVGEEPPSTAAEATAPVKEEKVGIVPILILEKLSSLESETPHSWDEVSKALEDLKPALRRGFEPPKRLTLNPEPAPTKPAAVVAVRKQAQRSKSSSSSFHTVADLDAKLSSSTKPATKSKPFGLRKAESLQTGPPKPEPRTGDPDRFKSVKENMFLVKDREERGKEGF